MSGSAATLPARAPAAYAAARLRSGLRGVPLGLVACVALAALTLIAPSEPTYDPWAWIIWGREILHLDLATTFGPSWKPLTVGMTTVFALFGGAAPALWMLAARTGALAGVLFAYRLGRRLGGPLAGGIAAVALLAAPWYVRNAAMGNSEGMQVAFALAAIECALAGRRMPAFLLALGLGLLRPEAWPFIGLYGAWIVWRERDRLVAVGAGLAALPLLWLVPEKLGSGDWLRAAHRAQQPVSGTPADADNPLTTVLREGWSMLGGPLRWSLVAVLVFALWRRERRLLALAGLIGAWSALVGIMSAQGFSGSTRYLNVPAAVAIVVVAAGLGLGARAVAERVRRPIPVALPVLAALACAGAFVGPWIAPSRVALGVARYQAGLTHQLESAISRAGGARRVRGCGQIVTGAYLVPDVAWHLHVHLEQVTLVPTAPGTVLRVHTTNGAPAVPSLGPLAARPVRTLAHTADWRILTTCGMAAR